MTSSASPGPVITSQVRRAATPRAGTAAAVAPRADAAGRLPGRPFSAEQPHPGVVAGGAGGERLQQGRRVQASRGRADPHRADAAHLAGRPHTLDPRSYDLGPSPALLRRRPPLPSQGAGGFEGGGTAFWTEGQRGQEDESGQRHVTGPPRLVLAPPAGGALLFGGSVTHAAQPVTAGERCVFVGSFTPTLDEDVD